MNMERTGVINGIINYLNLRDVGLLEMVFALTPILSGFDVKGVPLSLLMWVFLVLIATLQGNLKKTKLFKPLLFFVAYWLAHEIVVMFLDNVNFNGFIAQIIYFSSVFILYPNLEGKKVRGCFNWVAIIAIFGIVYQWSLIVRGNLIHPLEIPGLQMSESRLLSESLRPSSFFMEPAAYVEFMLFPLFLSLLDKKRLWTVTIILSIFLSTSTTGIVLSFIILATSVFVERFNIRSVFLIFLIGTALFYSLTHFEAFNEGINKIQNTDTDSNVRLTQGLQVVRSMSSEDFLFGVPFDNIFNFCKAKNLANVEYYGDNVFVPTFWGILILYGIVGLIFYINIYIQLFKKNRVLFPFLICVVAMWFSGGYGIQNSFAFSTIFLLVIGDMYLKRGRKKQL